MEYSYSPIRIAIADDHESFREGLIMLLNKIAKNTIEIIGEAKNGKELLGIVRQQNPDIVITDIKMPEMDGVEATRQITNVSPGTEVIGLSVYDDSYIIYDMLEA